MSAFEAAAAAATADVDLTSDMKAVVLGQDDAENSSPVTQIGPSPKVGDMGSSAASDNGALERATPSEPELCVAPAIADSSSSSLENQSAGILSDQNQDHMAPEALETQQLRNQPPHPDGIQIQLVPYAEPPAKLTPGIEVVERRIKEGTVIRIGRLVIKDGQPQQPKTGRTSDLDIWYSSKVVSRTHAELWIKDGQIYIKDIGSSSGTFLNKMRLSPSNKESRPYPIKESDVIQFGVDYKGKSDDIFKCVTVKVGFFDQSWVKANRKNANPVRFRSALKALLAASNPYGTTSSSDQSKLESTSDDDDPTSTDCCICLGSVAPFQALFIAPCSHCYHFKCVSSIIAQSAMFQCPMCRQVANLAASVSVESLNEDRPVGGTAGISTWHQQLQVAGKNVDTVDDLDDGSVDGGVSRRQSCEETSDIAGGQAGRQQPQQQQQRPAAGPVVALLNYDSGSHDRSRSAASTASAGEAISNGSSAPSSGVATPAAPLTSNSTWRSRSRSPSAAATMAGAGNAEDGGPNVGSSPSTGRTRKPSITAKLGSMFKRPLSTGSSAIGGGGGSGTSSGAKINDISRSEGHEQ